MGEWFVVHFFSAKSERNFTHEPLADISGPGVICGTAADGADGTVITVSGKA